ncbi:hypothetical protein V6N11_078948 [Hibiscus sabdariffa]|uniref:Uncharacterized protein n=1 Tax=Hibiscus sabdariffa TaxID=183260 RepID=A0ABR2RUM2_9ROSI
MQWEPLKNLSHVEMDNLPQLVSLPLWLQHLAQLKSLAIKNCSGLRSLFSVFQQLTSLERLSFRHSTELELSADDIQIFQDHTNLCNLYPDKNSKCQHLPEWLQYLTYLTELHLINLPNLTSHPDEMHCLTTLEALYIDGIPQLEERCRKEIGADWHKIAHIPQIFVNGLVPFYPLNHSLIYPLVQQYIVFSIFKL